MGQCNYQERKAGWGSVTIRKGKLGGAVSLPGKESWVGQCHYQERKAGWGSVTISGKESWVGQCNYQERKAGWGSVTIRKGKLGGAV